MAWWHKMRWRRRAELERLGPARQRARAQVKTPATGGGHWPRLAVMLAVSLLWLICALSLIARVPRGTYDFVAGQRVPVDIFAETSFEYQDLNASTLARREAMEAVPERWHLDSAKADLVQALVGGFFQALSTSEGEAPAAAMPAMPGPELPEVTERVRLLRDKLDEPRLTLLRGAFDTADKQAFLLDQLRQLLLAGVIHPDERPRYAPGQMVRVLDEQGREQLVALAERPTPAEALKTALASFALRFPAGSPEQLELLRESLCPLILVSLSYGAEQTTLAREAAAEASRPVMASVRQGEIFVTSGALVDRQVLEKLQRHNQAVADDHQRAGPYMLSLASQLLLILLLILGGVAAYCQAVPDWWRQVGRLWLVVLAIAGNLALLWGLIELTQMLVGASWVLLYPALPLSLSAMLLSLLLGARIGATAGVFQAILVALYLGQPGHLLPLAALSALTAALAVKSARTRVQTFRSLLYVPLVIFAVEALHLMVNHTPWQSYLITFGLAVANVLVVCVLANLLLPLCEWAFGLTTNLSLLELSDLNHPLLKRLQAQAPGSYHHTLNVATLSEHAAEAIGANTLLCRVASYYHDVGKLSNPEFFTENAFNGNRHQDLSPRLSTLIILNHVKEGLQLARQYKLPPPLVEVIASHHGTQLIYYFYHQALKQQLISADPAGEQEFRYPGPKPRSREASIICLADACEAASRSLDRPTPGRVESLVQDILRGKLDDGQFSESALTMAELQRVAAVIASALKNMLHGRVAYPSRDAVASARDDVRRAATNKILVITDTVVTPTQPGSGDAGAAPGTHADTPAQRPAPMAPGSTPALAGAAAAPAAAQSTGSATVSAG